MENNSYDNNKTDEKHLHDQCAEEPQINNGSSKIQPSSLEQAETFYEVSWEEAKKKIKLAPPPFFKSTRYFVMLLALLSPFVTTYSRTIINFALIDMIDPDFIAYQTKLSEATTSGTSFNSSSAVFDRDNSCPVDEKTRERLLDDDQIDIRRARTISGEKFAWDGLKQGLLKAAFTIGHTPFAIPGSRLSEIYGPYPVLNACSFIMGAASLLAPALANTHFILLFLDLVVLGITSSFMTPALMTTFTNWLTSSERSLMVTFYLITSRLGYAMSSILCGLLINAHFSWRYVFFSSGFISWTFLGLNMIFSKSWPHQHPAVSESELNYLAHKNVLIKEAVEQDKIKKKKKQMKKENLEMRPIETDIQEKQVVEEKIKAPWFRLWFAILSYSPIWAFIVTKFCVKMTADIVQIELPTYLKRVMHFSPKNNGIVNFSNFVMFCFGCFIVGMAANYIVKAKPSGLEKTAIRKIFQSVGSFGASLVLIAIALNVCNENAILVLLLTFFFVTTFCLGGEGQMPMDLSNRYSGTIHAIASSLSISGAIAPTLVGYYIKNHEADKDRWKMIWLTASLIAALGGLVFAIFGSAEVQPFDDLEDDLKKEKEKKKDLETGKINVVIEKNEKIDKHNNDKKACDVHSRQI